MLNASTPKGLIFDETAKTSVNARQKKLQKVLSRVLVISAFTIMMAAALYLVIGLLIEPQSWQWNPLHAVIALCSAAAILLGAIPIEAYLSRRRAKQIITWIENDNGEELPVEERASLSEIDKLLNEQDPYFRLHLAIALRDKARHFPIRVSDIADMREVLGEASAEQMAEINPQVSHLTKIIEKLDRGYAFD